MKLKGLLDKLFKPKGGVDEGIRSEEFVDGTPGAFINFAITYFSRSGVEIAAGSTEGAILDVEKTLNFAFPDDFKAFHLVFNGFRNWDMDNNHYSLWEFGRIVEEYEKEKKSDPDFIPVADYLINSHWFGYIRGREGIFKDYDRSNAIAKDFRGLVQLIIEDSSLLLS